MTGWGGVLIGLVSAVLGGLGGVVAVLKVRPENHRTEAESHRTEAESRRADAEAEKTDAEAHTELQKAAAQAIENIRKAADEAVKAALGQADRATKRMEALQVKLDGAETIAEDLRVRLRQTNEELSQTRRENEALRSTQAVERQQLLDQLSTERAQHAAAMAAVRQELTAQQLQRLLNGGVGQLLGEDFRT